MVHEERDLGNYFNPDPFSVMPCNFAALDRTKDLVFSDPKCGKDPLSADHFKAVSMSGETNRYGMVSRAEAETDLSQVAVRDIELEREP
jgi:hypothetical protein